ncbi:MAG: hypothetical protein NXI30_13310 [bacterium]|nr:hypothetical protein [bacterium]
MSEQSNPFRISPVEGPEGKGVRIEFDVETVRGPKQLKRATFGAFEILCDEGAMIGGDDSAPPPLAYFASSIAF